jgi:hypothetical protein
LPTNLKELNKFDYTTEEVKLFRKLSSPKKIQDYVNSVPFNFSQRGFYYSPRGVLKKVKMDCLEGAIFAAAALEFYGEKPLILDLRSSTKPYDYDHILAVFKVDGFFGAISKTNHAVLRYREPVYRSVRELVMSFFHEYFLTDGRKTLREYSDPLDLSYFNKINWRTTDKSLWPIHERLDKVKHYKILTPKQIRNLRKVDKIEIKASWEEEYKKK